MSVITCKQDLIYPFEGKDIVLQENDTVIFMVKGGKVEYQVKSTHLINRQGMNDEIFGLLEIPKRGFCRIAYRYEPLNVFDGWWPTSNIDDYAALTRLVKALYDECDKVNNPKTATELAIRYESLTKPTKKPLMQRLNTMMKKLLDSKTQTLIKADFLDTELDITYEGSDALKEMLFQEKIDALVVLAQEKLDEEAKECKQ